MDSVRDSIFEMVVISNTETTFPHALSDGEYHCKEGKETVACDPH